MTPLKESLINAIDSIKARFLDDDCDEEAILSHLDSLSSIHDNVFREDDYMNYDEAISFLGIGYNRNKLSQLTKKYNIKSKTFKNAKIGFKKADIVRLKMLLHKSDCDE